MKRKLVNLHTSYLFSKVSVIIFTLVFLILLLLYISSARSNNLSGYITNSYLYFVNISNITTLILTSNAIFIFSYSFNSKNDSYCQIILSSGISKEIYSLTKLVSLTLITLLFYIISWILYMICGFIYIKGFVFNMNYLLFFIESFFISIIYSLISLIFTIIFKNNFTFLLGLIIYIGVNSFESVNKYLAVFLPFIDKEMLRSTNNFSFLIIILILYLIITIKIYDLTEIRCE